MANGACREKHLGGLYRFCQTIMVIILLGCRWDRPVATSPEVLAILAFTPSYGNRNYRFLLSRVNPLQHAQIETFASVLMLILSVLGTLNRTC